MGECIGCYMADGRVGEELHHHTHIIRGGVEHHWGQMHRGASQVNYIFTDSEANN